MRRRDVLAGVSATLLLNRAAQARDITDMDGRRISVPAHIRRVYVAHDPPAIFLTSLAPELMIGFTFPLSAEAKSYLPPSVTRLPIVGGTSRINPERLLALKMDVAAVWNIRGSPDEFTEQVTAMGKTVVMVDAASCREYPAAFRFLGELLDRRPRAELLAREMERMGADLAATVGRIPENRRLRVYYADSADGLQSQCATAFRGGEEIEMAGGHNVLPCTVPDSMTASVGLNLERLLALDPDAIVARTAATAHMIRQHPGWQALRAVGTGRVYAYPEMPFNWAERPHSQFKFLAMQWLANKLYPTLYPFGPRPVQDFFRIFYGKELSDAQAASLL